MTRREKSLLVHDLGFCKIIQTERGILKRPKAIRINVDKLNSICDIGRLNVSNYYL
jgi:hypothetical protein